jgi:hypothetical protein
MSGALSSAGVSSIASTCGSDATSSAVTATLLRCIVEDDEEEEEEVSCGFTVVSGNANPGRWGGQSVAHTPVRLVLSHADDEGTFACTAADALDRGSTVVELCTCGDATTQTSTPVRRGCPLTPASPTTPSLFSPTPLKQLRCAERRAVSPYDAAVSSSDSGSCASSCGVLGDGHLDETRQLFPDLDEIDKETAVWLHTHLNPF